VIYNPKLNLQNYGVRYEIHILLFFYLLIYPYNYPLNLPLCNVSPLVTLYFGSTISCLMMVVMLPCWCYLNFHKESRSIE
jgi:hypothetical protein